MKWNADLIEPPEEEKKEAVWESILHFRIQKTVEKLREMGIDPAFLKKRLNEENRPDKN
jgi:hypothetical protein